MKYKWLKYLSHVDLFVILLLGVILLIYFEHKPDTPSFAIQHAVLNKSGKDFQSELIPQPKFLKSAHSATFTTLENGDLIALWFAGSHEGKPDVKIWQSVYHINKYNKGHWESAVAVVSPELLSHGLKRYVRKVGNPVIYRAPNGELHLFVVSVTIGGWSGSRLNHLISEDDGKTWHIDNQLVLSPFFNLSTLDRTNAITLNDGGFYLPVYHECIFKYPEVLRFDRSGRFLEQIRMSDERHLLQPSIVPITDSEAWAFLRNRGKLDHILYQQTTNNGGRVWSALRATNLDNHDSSIAATIVHIKQNRSRKQKKELLMVHDVGQHRSKLALAVSQDGLKWQDIYYFENTPGNEFSYPAIMAHNGVVDILYTWKRKQIKHVRFNLRWLQEIQRKAFQKSIRK